MLFSRAGIRQSVNKLVSTGSAQVKERPMDVGLAALALGLLLVTAPIVKVYGPIIRDHFERKK